MNIVSHIVPLHDDIEKKFGQFMTIYRTNQGRFYLYKYLSPYDDGTAKHETESFLVYDETDCLFRFNGKRYTKCEFIKVMNLLAFT